MNEHIESMKDAAMLADTASVKSTPTYRALELFDCTHLIPLCRTTTRHMVIGLRALCNDVKAAFEFGPWIF